MQPKGVEHGTSAAAAATTIPQVKAGHPALGGVLRIVLIRRTGGRDDEGAAHVALATAATSLPATAMPALGAGGRGTRVPTAADRGATSTAAKLPYL